jgi:formylmethanofuran dehydrogenase subunit E
MNEIKLWNPEKREFAVYDGNGNKIYSVTLSENEVYCDLCNAQIFTKPVPMIGSYALCFDCLDSINENWREEIDEEILEDWEKQLNQL